MTKSIWSDPIFHDETSARAWFEAARWSHGPVCPHCKWTKHYPSKKVGVYRCADMTCMKDFTVITATVMARSHAKLTKWAIAFHLAASSMRDLSAGQLQRELGCHYDRARSMLYRVREAMRRDSFELPFKSSDVAGAYAVRPSERTGTQVDRW
jgi:transposase-like protein